MKWTNLDRPIASALALTGCLVIACADNRGPTAPAEVAIESAKGGVPGAPTSAVVRFGNNSVGTQKFGFDHPSSHARDNIIPNTTVIRAGGTVTFLVQPAHRVAIYEPGISPEDIRTIPGVTVFDYVAPPMTPGPPFIPSFLLDEPNGRLFFDTSLSFVAERTVEFTFEEPGKYLVICSIFPHFAFSKMFAWVDVK
jgi:plastocyanin